MERILERRIPEYKYFPSSFMLEIDATEMLNKIRKQNLSDSEEKESGEKVSQKRWSERVVRNSRINNRNYSIY